MKDKMNDTIEKNNRNLYRISNIRVKVEKLILVRLF